MPSSNLVFLGLFPHSDYIVSCCNIGECTVTLVVRVEQIVLYFVKLNFQLQRKE